MNIFVNSERSIESSLIILWSDFLNRLNSMESLPFSLKRESRVRSTEDSIISISLPERRIISLLYDEVTLRHYEC